MGNDGRVIVSPHWCKAQQREYGWCENGQCQYECFEGAGICDGNCTDLFSDPENCGACGNVCPEATPFCTRGICTQNFCNGTDLLWDPLNCGECGKVCGPFEVCEFGTCIGSGPCVGEGC